MVPGCTNCSKKTKGSDISYHRLPNDQHIRRAWLGRVRRENLPNANSCYVCSVHFTPDCFEGSLKAAVPPAAHPVLRITMDVRNRSETVVSYLVKPTWRRQERQPQVR